MKSGITVLYAITLTLFSVSIIYPQSTGIELLWEKSVHVSSMEFTPDGGLLITGGRNVEINCYPYTCGQVKIWDVADSSLLFSLGNFNMGLPNDIDISNDGQRFISGNGSIYCPPHGGCLSDRIGQYIFNMNGSQINSVSDPGGIIYSIAYSSDETIIAAGTGYNNTGEIRIYDSIFNLLNVLPGHGLSTNSLIFTPDGQYLISGGSDGNIKFWDYNTGTLVRTLQHGTYLNGGTDIRLSISADGEFLASTGEGNNISVKIWKVEDGSLIHNFTIEDEFGGFSLVEFSPNGLYLLNGMALYGLGGLGWHSVLKFYEVATGNLVREYIDSLGSPVSGGVRAIGLSPTGNNFFAYSTGYQSTARLRLALTDLNLVSTIPVELVSFTASVSENDVILKWQTATETNNSGFEINRKKIEARNQASEWETIGFVPGFGTTIEPKSYSLIDKNIDPANYSYRLVQIDFDGTRNESEIVNVVVSSLPTEYSLSQNYPNPFNPTTIIQYSIPENGNVKLEVYNSVGEAVATLANGFQEAGVHKINFNASDLSSGIYFYKLQAGSFIQIRKMIIVK